MSKESNVAYLKSTEEDTNLLMKAGHTKKSSIIVVHWVFFIKSESGDPFLFMYYPCIYLDTKIQAGKLKQFFDTVELDFWWKEKTPDLRDGEAL